jgi:DUF1680 family protein
MFIASTSTVAPADWLTAATDLARHTRDASLLRTVHTLWADMERKTYVTGGIGADPATEGFSDLACPSFPFQAAPARRP